LTVLKVFIVDNSVHCQLHVEDCLWFYLNAQAAYDLNQWR